MTNLTICYILFFISYLVLLSRRSDKYHSDLKQISDLSKVLQYPNASIEKIQPELIRANQRVKKKSYLLLMVLFVLHEICVWMITTEMGKYGLYSWYIASRYPLICLAVVALIMFAIHWLKGKGGGIPSIRLPGNSGFSVW